MAAAKRASAVGASWHASTCYKPLDTQRPTGLPATATWVACVGSAIISGVGYDAPSHCLFVLFPSGDLWEYRAVPRPIYTSFLRLKRGRGAFFWRSVRGRFGERRVGVGCAVPLAH